MKSFNDMILLKERWSIMKWYDYIILSFIILLVFCNKISGEKETYIPLHKESKMKKYNKDAQWKKVDCKHCSGKGYIIIRKFNKKQNKMEYSIKPCPYCNGKGYTGMSKY